MNLAIILARKGSKRLKNKNKTEFLGKPLIYYSISFAKKNRFDKIVVTTDDKDIIEYSKKLGVETILRPSYLATDKALTIDVIRHCIKEINCEDFSSYTILQPTSPLRKANLFRRAIEKFNNQDVDSVISISKNFKKIGKINKYFEPLYEVGCRSQDLNNYYENGSIYILNKKNIFKNNLFGDKIGYVITTEEYSKVDIDDLYDLKIAEIMFKNNYEDLKYLL